MGEHKVRSRKRAEILLAAERCIYCGSTTPTTIEHMPPRGIFQGKDRPSGWEFPACKRCNEGSRGADAVAQLMALMEPVSERAWKVEKIKQIHSAVRRHAPAVAAELALSNNSRPMLVNFRGLLRDSVEMHVDGPATVAHLDVFAAKMAMATFATYTGQPLNVDGFIYTQWFLNSGMSKEAFEAIVGIMPSYGQLQQGQKVSGRQFELRYNSDMKSIIAALVSLHGCLSILIVATDNEELKGPLAELLAKHVGIGRPGSQITRPGLREIDLLANTQPS